MTELLPRRGVARALGWVVGIAIYVAVGAWYAWPALSSGGTAFLGGHGDAELFMWYLRWTPFALSHHLDPLVTSYIHYPDVVNAMWNTSVIAPAVLAWPLTAALNVVQAYNVLVFLSFPLSALSALAAFRRIVDSPIAAWVGGLAYGFCPFLVSHSIGHLFLLLGAIAPPLFLLLLDDLLRRRRRPAWLLGIGVGVLAVALLMTAEEVLATTAVVAALALAWLAALAPSLAALRAAAVRVAIAAGPALVSFAVLAAVPLRTEFLGPSRMSGALQPRNAFVSDLWGFVVPPALLHFTTPGAIALTNHFTGDGAENNAYLGVVVLALLVVAVVVARRRRVAFWAAGGLVVAAALSMGPELHARGALTGVQLPWAAIERLPLMENVLPSRMMLFADLFAGLLLAVLADAGLAARWHVLRVAAPLAAVAGLVTWLPAVPIPASAAETPAFFTGRAVDAIPEGAPILLAPVNGTVAQRWQAASGMRFRMSGGAAWNPGPTFGPPPTPLMLALSVVEQGRPAPRLTPATRAALTRDLRRRHPVAIVVGPTEGSGVYSGRTARQGQAAEVAFLTRFLGRGPDEWTGGVAVWWMRAR